MTHDIGPIEVISCVLALHISTELETCSAKFMSMRSQGWLALLAWGVTRENAVDSRPHVQMLYRSNL